MSNRIAKTLLASLPVIDHRHIGSRQKLFMFHDLSHGSCFFFPRGARIYNKLIDYIRQEYSSRNYHEVITPNIYSEKLWRTSGHFEHYEKNMIKCLNSERDYTLKPMNCPGHCLMYKGLGRQTSQDLPIRWADFGALHRNELSGTLSGLARLRRFQQDDAHIFCTQDQVTSEVRQCLEFADKVYKDFGFTFELKLALRPEKFLGDAKIWDDAEQSLRVAMSQLNKPWEEQEQEGAFYGPKIDLFVKDAHGRSQQCATVQLDFQLPERFDLKYFDKDINDNDNQDDDDKDKDKNLLEVELDGCHSGRSDNNHNHNDNYNVVAASRVEDMISSPRPFKRPVIIHRAIFGSIERFIAMLAESCRGKWPFWMSPLQAVVITIGPQNEPYATRVRDRLRAAGFWVDMDANPSRRLGKKVRDAMLLPYNMLLFVGDKEEQHDAVQVRLNVDFGVNSVDVSSTSMSSSQPDGKAINMTMPLNELVTQLAEFESRRVALAEVELARSLRAQVGRERSDASAR